MPWLRRLAAAAALVLGVACGGRSALEGSALDSASQAGAFASGGAAASPARGSSGLTGFGAASGTAGSAASAGDGGSVPPLAGPDPRRTPPVFCSVDYWCGSKANFIAIWGSSASDIWVIAERVGDLAGTQVATNTDERSALLHWDGVRWTATQFDEAPTLRAIWGSSKEDVWVVGSTVRHFDGKAWSPLPPPGDPVQFNSVSGTGPRDVWAVGSRAIEHFDGSTWSPAPVATGETFLSVWSSSPSEVWALGDKTLAYFNGITWSSLGTPAGMVARGVWSSDRREAWTAGQAGTLERWSVPGRQTTDVVGEMPAGNFRAIWGRSQSDGWGVGENGLVAHWDGKVWSAAPQRTESNLNGVWSFGSSAWFVGDNGTFLQFDGETWRSSPLASRKLKRLGGTSDTDVWAAGQDILHWDGKVWNQVARPGSDEVLALWSRATTDAWAVGAHGLLLHWDGVSWRASASPTSVDIKGVWGSARDDVWAVDADGKILHFDGAFWSVFAARSFGPLESVWGRNALDVIAVGGSQRVHFDGTSWSLLPPHPNEGVEYRVAFGNGGFVWIAGHVGWHAYKAGGTHPKLGRWDGQAMTDDLEPKDARWPVNLNYSSVVAGWAESDHEVWLALPQVMHWDGAKWWYSATGGTASSSAVAALWGSSAELWALTSQGQILSKSRVK